MKAIKISELAKGTVAEIDYFGRDGRILIKKGALIDEALIGAINRRNISQFFIQEEGEDIKKLLSLQELETFELEEPGFNIPSEPEPFSAPPPFEPPPPPEKALPVLAIIRRGEEGVQQFLKSREVQAVEQALESRLHELTVPPSETPIKNLAREMAVGERSSEYKKGLVSEHVKAVEEIKSLFSTIRAGRPVQAGRIMTLVQGFTAVFLNDRHIFLNLATLGSGETDYTYAHSLNVCLIAIAIAASRGLDRDQVTDIGVGALLHDVGTLFIPDEIRFKKEPLTRDEIFEIQKHPMIGIHLIEQIKGLSPVTAFICYQSHERENREGYPKQRNGRLIHDYAKIVMVADVYESLISPRPYRDALAPYKAMEHILKHVKQGYFNAEIVKYFLEFSSLFPIGSLVMLNTGELAKVVRPNGPLFSRPWISIVVGADNRLIEDSQIKSFDLRVHPDLKIIQAIDNAKLHIDAMRGF